MLLRQCACTLLRIDPWVTGQDSKCRLLLLCRGVYENITPPPPKILVLNSDRNPPTFSTKSIFRPMRDRKFLVNIGTNNLKGKKSDLFMHFANCNADWQG